MEIKIYSLRPMLDRKVRDTKKSISFIGCFFALSFFFLSTLQSQAQVKFQTVFAHSDFNLAGHDVHEVSDGYVLCSEVPNVMPSEGITILIKTDFNGVLLWQKKFDGSNCKFKPVSTGGFIIAGQISGSYSVLYKVDDNGELEWSKKYSATHGMTVNDVLETVHNGNQAFLLVGAYTRQWVMGTTYGSDFMAIKTDDDGDIIWAHCYGRNTFTIGYNLNDYGLSAIEVPSTDPNNPSNPDFLLTGVTDNYNTSHQDELYVVKIWGTDGTKTFDKLYVPLYPVGNPLYVSYHNYGKSIVKDNSTNYAICGQTNNITTIDASGALQWTKNYSGTVTLNNIVKDVNNTGYAVGVGYGSGLESSLMKIAFTGGVSWTKNYEGVTSFIGATSDYGYLVGAGIPVTAESGNYGYLLVKTDASGQSDCYETSESIGTTDVPAQVVDLGGEDLDISSSITTDTGFDNEQTCLRVYSRDCVTPATTTYVYGGALSFTVTEEAFSIYSDYYIDQATSDWPTWYTIKWTLIESGPTYTNVTEMNPYEYYTQARPKAGFQKFINSPVRTDKTLCVDVTHAGCKTRECFGRNPAYGYNFREAEPANDPGNLDGENAAGELLLSPNPASGSVSIQLPNGEGGKIELLDNKGSVVKTIETTSATQEVNISQLQKGLYFVRVTQSNGIKVSKLEVY